MVTTIFPNVLPFSISVWALGRFAKLNVAQNVVTKKHTNENLQQYIINYKLSLAAIRLRHSDMRINEIASELGFTDDSHLTKTFRKYKGVSLAEYSRGSLALAS